jgi:hypothetical protein
MKILSQLNKAAAFPGIKQGQPSFKGSIYLNIIAR